MIKHSLVALAVMTVSAFAEPAKPPKIEGTFGFDVHKPQRSCSKVAGALLTKLDRDYRCEPPDNGGQTGSGVVFIASCKAKRGTSEYMLFTSAADCKTERETQLANAG